MAKELTDENFEELVIKSTIPVLVDFKGTWCNPCVKIAPMIDELSNDFEGKALIFKVDVDDCPITTKQFEIKSIPALLFFKNGEVVDKQVGAVPKTVLADKLNNLLQ